MANIVLKGNTSGSITIASPDVSGVNVLTLPVETGTILTTNTPLPEVSSVEFAGAGTSSGNITITAPDTDETNTLTFPETTGTFAIESSLGMRNIIINGNMQIAQRGTSATGITTTGYYTCDRWSFSYSNPTAVFSQTQDTDVPTGQGFANSLKTSCTTAGSLAADEKVLILQRFEGFNVQSLAKGTTNAKPTTVSFWVKSNKIGTYIVNLFDTDNLRTISKSYTISSANTWEKKAVTFEGDTTGVLNDDNQQSLVLSWGLAIGSDATSGTLGTAWAAYSGAAITGRFAGQVDLSDSTSNYINITGVQLEVGTTATPFENLQYGTQLQLCQRYYQQYGSSGSTAIGAGIWFTTTQVLGLFTFPVIMRTAPTMATTGIGWIQAYRASGASTAAGSGYMDVISNHSARFNISGWDVAGVAGMGTYLQLNADKYIFLNAEL